jgi:hypothetical protein
MKMAGKCKWKKEKKWREKMAGILETHTSECCRDKYCMVKNKMLSRRTKEHCEKM